MAGKGASGRRKGEEDSDHRGGLIELFQCKRVSIKQLTGRRLPISTGDRGGELSACVSEDLR